MIKNIDGESDEAFREHSTVKGSCLYISFMNEDIRPGYINKIHSQVKSLSRIKKHAYLIIMSDNGIRRYEYVNGELIDKNEIQLKRRDNIQTGEVYTSDHKSRSRSLVMELKAFRIFSNYAEKVCSEEQIKYVYVRRIVPITYRLIAMLKNLKRSGAIVIYEYPTFPWKEEMKKNTKNIMRKCFYLLDCAHYESLINVPDYITYLGDYNGKDCRFVKIQNCGDPSDYPIIKNKKKDKNKDIHLIGIAYVAYGHGFDLVIESLHKYYEKNEDRKVFFHIVGEISRQPALKSITKKYGLEDYVIFHGFKTGAELDELCSICDIGVNALRTKDEISIRAGVTTLKTVEYTLRGMLQIGGAGFTVDRIRIDVPCFLKIVDENFDMKDVVSFYDNATVTPDYIREYGIQHMSWDNVFMDMFKTIDKKED